MDINQIVKLHKTKLQDELEKVEMRKGEMIFDSSLCQLLSQSGSRFELIMSDESDLNSTEYVLHIESNGNIIPFTGGEPCGWHRYSYACLLQIENELHLLDPKEQVQHKKYTRQGMINRVLKERKVKADKAHYQIRWADNIYGDHILTNERGTKYTVFLRDFKKETGYSNSLDAKYNKLGTTKHIMYAFGMLKEDVALYKKLGKTYPFIEIFCDPLNDYKITWYYPYTLPANEQTLIARYFGSSKFIDNDNITGFLGFINVAEKFRSIRIRPEVKEKVEAAFENRMLANLSKQISIDFGVVNANLYPYQKEGVRFALFKKTAIIADEMGLGKTLQAITTAILKKETFGFKKTLIICPASLKEQWKREIDQFTNEKALIISGFPDERALQYTNPDFYFHIINYETVLRDQLAINKACFDFLILDEVQRAKNYETKTSHSLKNIDVKHKLAITGTPIENRLIDIYSIMEILDPEFFGPLWEFSYQHCLFDPERHDKINGYYNLQKLNKQLDKILIRREKQKVLDQLPNVQQIRIPVNLSPLQAEYHASYAKSISRIIRKKYLTPFDLQRLQQLLANMRMVCDSTFLIDDQTNESPKLDELRNILIDKLDVPNTDVKIIIFSEWIKVHKLIGKLLRDHQIGFVELNGSIPVKLRGELIRKFESSPQYKVFLSTETGGSGLNLQVANTLINFELPWNPAKKNQRIGRIDRLGQKSARLTIYSFVSRQSIEEQIAAGLLIKQSLFDGVMNENDGLDFVDFSSKGRSQFIQQLEEFIAQKEIQQQETEVLQAGLQQEAIQAEATIETPVADEIDLVVAEPELQEEITTSVKEENAQKVKAEELEKVMNNGMSFLAGLFKMATGKEMGIESQKIEINRSTGEVTMKFKLPVG